MKKYIFTIALLAACAGVKGQLTVEQCWDRARANYPLIERMELIGRSADYTLANASRGYLPQLNLGAKASYQSDVTSVPISMPGVNIPQMPKDQYDVRLEVSQVVWDGGRIKAGKQTARAAAEIEKRSLEVELYALRERVNEMFFSILLLDRQIAQNTLYTEQLGRNHAQIEACVKNGVANRTDLDAVRAEQLETERNTTTMRSSREAYVTMLAVMIGSEESEIFLVEPLDAQAGEGALNRSELWLFDAQQQSLRSQLQSLSARNRPVLGAFATGGYGQPGLNMLKTGFEPYYITGLRLSWNFGTLYTKKNDRRLIENDMRGVDLRRETFEFNTRMQTIGERRQIDNIREVMRRDEEIVALRENIRRAAEARMVAGTINGTDLMREVTAENLARQTALLHRVQLMQAIYKTKTTRNN